MNLSDTQLTFQLTIDSSMNLSDTQWTLWTSSQGCDGPDVRQWTSPTLSGPSGPLSPRSPLSGRLFREVTPAARFLYPIQYNAILLKVTEV